MFNNYSQGRTLTALLLGILMSMSQLSQAQESTLLGTWNVEEVHWISEDTTISILDAQPGIFMVSPSRYSFIWTPTRVPRVPFKVLSNPTEEEAIAGFRSIVFNTGTYEIDDLTFKIVAQIAKVPGFEGGKQTFVYDIKGDKLQLRMVDETYPDGSKPDWYGKWVTKFVMSRID